MAKRSHARPNSQATTPASAKTADLKADIEESPGTFLTSNQGVPVNDDHNSLKAGDRP